MIYDLLALRPTNKHVRLSNEPANDPHCAIIVIRSLDLSILRTCKTVHDEAQGILVRLAKGMLSTCALQILRPVSSDHDMIVLFLCAIRDHFKTLCTMYGTRGSRDKFSHCLLYTSPSPRDRTRSRMPSSA